MFDETNGNNTVPSSSWTLRIPSDTDSEGECVKLIDGKNCDAGGGGAEFVPRVDDSE